MVRLILRCILGFSTLAPTLAWSAEVQFEGYYRIELDSQPIGYVIQRYETDPKQQIFRSAYFMKTNEVGGDIQESLKAESKTKNKAEFEPTSYQYTGQVGSTLKSIDANFKKEMMEIVRSDGKKAVKETYKIPSGTFLSTFLGYLILQQGLKTGKKFVYSAVAEEEGNSYRGEATVKGEEKYAGQTVFRVDNTFKGESFTSFVTPQGEMLGTASPTKKLSLILVPNPADATKGFIVPNKSLILTFGNIPAGKTNVLARGLTQANSAMPNVSAPPTTTPASKKVDKPKGSTEE